MALTAIVQQSSAPELETPPESVWGNWKIGVVTAGYVVFCAWLSLELNVWRDEMYSLHSSEGTVAHAVRQALGFELQPPVYFALLSVWRLLDSSVFFARLMSTASGALAIVTAGAISRRLFPRVDPAWGAALVATHPFVVWAGTEIRVYALVLLLGAALFLAFLSAYGDTSSRWARAAFTALAVAAIYTQYYLGVLLLCFGAALLVVRGPRRTLPFVADLGVVGLMAVPLL
ncbi:MAG TPA: glycosyltransferase family 39 protein, partial [Polyangiaceae bacterium]|nr:glycosyltransferase family 39 protein [Polyangiaceae bacterium]